MASPEQLDRMLEVTSSRSWIALLCVGVVLLAGLFWGIKGRLSTKAPGRGVMVRAGNLVTVGSLGSGRVMSVSVHPGDLVHKGEMIAIVSQPLLEDKLQSAQLDVLKMQDRLGPETDMSATNMGLEIKSIEGQRNAIDGQIVTVQDQIKELNNQITATQDLYEKGLVTRQQVAALRERSASLNNQISSLRVQQIGLNGNAYKAEMSNRLNHVQALTRVQDARTNLHLMQSEYNLSSQVVSPYDGEVVQVQALPGTLVAQGSTIVSLQPAAQQMEVIAYVQATESKAVLPGMEVEIMPTNVRPEEYGFIRGSVLSVAAYPATDQDLMTTFENNSLTQLLTSSGPVTEVRLKAERNPNTPSGFLWSSHSGPPTRFTPGTMCTINVVTRNERPIRLLFPYVKAKLGVY